ncbi:acyl-CoA dehydrogenase family protein [Streptomyces cavernicola]|uniref:Acyl-CoA dehydrogenase family protein n=1 Tax=Streptomyces cavernicola TaxID=3043613 RepID=A0ABT6SE09_9ACTN|nr:acyl-CoA dehydrogenase family protein [Streptomyces sp. B-S-A6]MDI3406199.1 acyl-CoA dehydrogenase family protein [Streptomyces sp. B-S-A6]
MEGPGQVSTSADLLYSETEDELRSVVRDLLTDRCTAGGVLARIETDEPHDRELWKALATEMGLAGLLVPEKLGGQGATHREAAVVLEELGRAVAPVPYLSSAVIATELLLGCPQERPQVAAQLGELASGRLVGALVVPFATAPHGPYPRVRRSADGLLHGTVTAVADAAGADLLYVATDDALYALAADQDGVTVTPRTSFDLTRPLTDVTLDGARGGEPVSEDPDTAVRRGLRAGAGLLASEQLGLADWCLAETVAYTRDRHQFNRPVGSFQALKHRLADLWLETVNARAAARNAADALATDSAEAPLAAALAQAYCSPVAVHAAEEALQLHGGIGMTWEHPVHLYLKRAKADATGLGSAGRHREAIAELVDLQAP